MNRFAIMNCTIILAMFCIICKRSSSGADMLKHQSVVYAETSQCGLCWNITVWSMLKHHIVFYAETSQCDLCWNIPVWSMLKHHIVVYGGLYRNITVWSLLKLLSVVYAQHHSVVYAETSQCGSCSKIPLDGLWMTEFRPNANVFFILFYVYLYLIPFTNIFWQYPIAIRPCSGKIAHQYIICRGF